jgi:hypothetical protein
MATKTEQLLAYLQTPGLSDAAIANEINRIGISAQEVSALTGVPVDTVQQRITAATPVTTATAAKPTFATQAETGLYNYLQTPNLTDAQIAAEVNRLGLNAQQISNMTGVPVGQVQSRLTPYLPKITTPVVTKPVVTTTPTNTANFSAFTNFLKTPGLTDQQIAAEMNRLGITNSQVAGLTGIPETEVQNRFNATAPFSNATQGFAQNFNNYQSIPIGAQYNPAVTAGGASPYSQVMGQMRPVGNPYAGVVGNLSMGGYNPGLYDQIAAANTAKAAAADTATAAAAAQQLDASSTGGMAQGGMVHGGLMFGMNPPGPDDGAVNLDMGEYVIKKSSVNKYGKGLLDMINEGKVPAKKMKSLLG